ncbi:MAG TPA: hypothetical protein VMI10_18100 [Terriglobales bacterium]|nr:hypothetical protein [Terriglobales bacterium]
MAFSPRTTHLTIRVEHKPDRGFWMAQRISAAMNERRQGGFRR